MDIRNRLLLLSANWLILLILASNLLHTTKGLPELCDVTKVFDFSPCLFVGTSMSSWSSAHNFCKQFGGDLLSIHSEDERNELAKRLQLFNDDSHSFWIGFNDLRKPGDFEWTDGSAVNYIRWNSDKQEWNPETDTGSCVSLNPQMTWDITNCSSEKGFVCLESHFTISNRGCDEGMTRFRNSCYWLLLDDDNWKASENWCRSENGHLVAINDELENMFLYNIIMMNKTSYWIGFQRQVNSDVLWTTMERSNYSNWIGNRDLSSGNCPVISRGGKWIMQSCTSVHPGGICEKLAYDLQPVGRGSKTTLTNNEQITEECPVGWQRLKNKCYKIEKQFLLSWNEAFAHCLELKGHLASFATENDERYVFTQTPADINDSQTYWIGLKCTNSTYDASWTDGTPLRYTVRDATEEQKVRSDNPDDSEFCVAHSLQAHVWLCLPCSFKIGSACGRSLSTQDPQETAPSTNPTGRPENYTPYPTSEPLQCPSGWETFAQNCYIAVNGRRNWKASRSICQKLGADLVSIHSREQQDYVIQLITNNKMTQAWIGYNAKKFQTQWSDGSSIDYKPVLHVTNGYDESTEPLENCVIIDDMNAWVEEECARQFSFICQKALQNQDATTMPSTSTDVDHPIIEQTDPVEAITYNANDGETAAPMTGSAESDEAIVETSDYGVADALGGITTGMSGGTIAGIVMGCLILTALCIIGLIYLYQRNNLVQAVKNKISFENNLYNPYGDQIQLHPTVREATT